MESLIINKSTKGKRTVYQTTFKKPGTIKKISEYLKTNKVPERSLKLGVSLVYLKEKNEDEIERVMTSPFPESSALSSFIGEEPVLVKYDIAYDDSTLIIKSVNPERLKKFFKFTEVLTVTEEDGILTFDREAQIFNAGINGFFSGLVGTLTNPQQYNDFFNMSNLTFYLGMSEEINQ